MKDFRPAKKRPTVTVVESVRTFRELQELSQNQLAVASGIPQASLSTIENGRVRLGVERAKVLARALKCHPGVLVSRLGTAEGRGGVTLGHAHAGFRLPQQVHLPVAPLDRADRVLGDEARQALQSTLMLLSRITWAHRSVSSLI